MDMSSLCIALISKTEVQLNKATFAITLIDLSMPPLLGLFIGNTVGILDGKNPHKPRADNLEVDNLGLYDLPLSWGNLRDCPVACEHTTVGECLPTHVCVYVGDVSDYY